MSAVAPSSPERPPSPTRLGKYAITGLIASGGMATVFVARQQGAAGFERLVAIKVCYEHLRQNAAFASMFLEEARLAARIRHPNVVATLDVNDGRPMYLVMEYVEGGSLSSLISAVRRRRERIPTSVALRILMDMLAGLSATHECRAPDGRSYGLVHCDVSPQNVLVGLDGTARITDFGIARALTFIQKDDGLIKGKMSYLAPEQLVSGAVTPRADLFSAGVVLWELLTGAMLFPKGFDRRAGGSGPFSGPSGLVPRAPAIFHDILVRALDGDPSRRFASAVDVLAALEALPVQPASARVVGEYVRRHLGRHPRDVSTSPPRTSSSPSAIVRVSRPVDDADRETPTQVLAPSPDLLAAATARPPALSAGLEPRDEPAAARTTRTRRIVVALALVLLGCAAGLLGSTHSVDAEATPVSSPH